MTVCRYSYGRWEKGMTIRVDGIVKSKTKGLEKVILKYPVTISDGPD